MLRHVDAKAPRLFGRPDARHQQQLRRSDRPRRERDLPAGPLRSPLPVEDVLHAGAPAPVEDQALCERIRDDGEVRPVARLTEVGVGGAVAGEVNEVDLGAGDAFGLLAVAVRRGGRTGQSEDSTRTVIIAGASSTRPWLMGKANSLTVARARSFTMPTCRFRDFTGTSVTVRACMSSHR